MGTAAGYRTGLFTSPHLETVEERIRLDGASIAGGDLAGLLQEILAEAERLSREPITYFEALTAAAYLHFARQRVDLAVFEVGLGGRLDATNAGEPILSVICSIGLDHQAHLGDTLGAIAREKAGILRSGVPAVSAVGSPEASAVVRQVAEDLGAPLTSALDEVRREHYRPLGWRGQELRLRTPRQELDLTIALLGEHQLANLASAVAAAEALAGQGFHGLRGAALERGAEACRWPGRLEVVELPRGRRALLDAGHNVDASRSLRRFLDSVEGEMHLLFGTLEDKDAGGILEILAPRFRRCVLTRPWSPRARAPEALAGALRHGPAPRLEDEPEAALDSALEDLAASDARTLVICGSIFLVGPVRGFLRRRFGAPAPAAQILTGPGP